MKRFKEPAQLHNHSKYSLLDAVPSPAEWVAWCLENNTPGFAITDHGTAISMYDAIRFKQHIKEYNKENKTNHPEDACVGIPGVELYVKLNAEDKGHYHITAWATSNEGYFNLMKLSSEAYKDTVNYFGNIKARVTYDMIKKYKKGIKFGTGCIVGPIGDAIMNENNYALAEERFLMYKEMFGDDLYIEFHTNDVTHEFNKKTGTFSPFAPDECSCDGNKQKGYNLFLRDMVDKYGGKPVPVTDAHFIKSEDKILQDCLLKNGNDNGWYFYESYHQQRAEQMFEKLRTHLGDWLTEDKFKSWIENTYEVMDAAKKIDIKFDYHLPAIPIPDHIKAKTDDYDMQTYYLMIEKIKEHGRWKDDPIYVKRFKTELDVVKDNSKLNFIPYFLVYEDIGTFARSQGILQNIARGSAGGSLISYYLKVIHVDPIKANLPFERFLSHARINAGSFPDIDADIGDTARPLVMKYLKEKYGVGFAQIATFNKIKTKNAIKDAMFALYGKNRKDPDVESICNTIEDSPQGVDEHDFLYGYTDEEGNYNLGQWEVNEQLRNFFARYPDVENMVKRLIGGIRGWSRHASAFVISTLDISATRVPTMIMMDKTIGAITCTQYDAGMVEKCGLVKADILGIKTLSAVSECVDLIKARTGTDFREIDADGVDAIYRLPEDNDIYGDFYLKKTDSSFQFNTSLIKGMVQEFAPLNRKHLADFTALARPGALDFKMDGIISSLGQQLPDMSAAKVYMGVKSGEITPTYIHEDLKPILEDTYSVAVYQEQIMRILSEIGGFTGEESDMVRSAISKKKKEVIQSTFDKLRDSTTKRGWTDEQGEQLCKMVEAFSRYSFNRSHSYAYAELGYITMYLKHHYPLEWWTAVLNSEDNEDKIRKHVTLLGDMVAPPSAMVPANQFKIFKDKIVAPISAIKGIGPSVVTELCLKGPFASLEDFITRVQHNKVNTGGVSCLIKGRAFDDMMDQTITDYGAKRQEFMDRYVNLRGGPKKVFLKEELANTDAMSIFLMEREVNRCFNKHLLDDPDLTNIIVNKWAGLSLTGNKRIPMKIGTTHILAGINVAQALLKAGHQDDIGMILLYESSSMTHGTSKKTGRPWSKFQVNLSDGYTTIECINWDKKQALKWPKNSVVYVRGTLQEGWRTPVNLKLKEIERVET